MADNLNVTEGSGKTIATDDIGGVHYSRHKLTLGAGGTNDGDVSSSNPVPSYNKAQATGGYTPNKLISASGTNATNIKNGAGKIGYLMASNINASPRYLKIYDKSSTPIVGTDTPKHTFLIPGNTAGAGTNLGIPSEGIDFSSGIGMAITTGPTDADTGAVAANEIIVNYGYK